MGISIMLLAVGIAMLMGGGDLLIRGSVALATRLRISPTIIGLTVVAFGTSTPELVVNLTAALRGTPELAFGNVVGSNIANIGLLLGLSALVRPIVVHRTIILRETPMMVLVGVATAAMVEGAFTGTGDGSESFGRGEGIILLLLFGVFVYYTIGDALRQRASDAYVHGVEDLAAHARPLPAPLALAFVAVGLGLLIGGGQLTVRGGTDMARWIGVPDVVIGLSLVAVGTSLPEMATNLIAIRRNQADMAVGNIIGSNIYNLAFVFGITSTISPVPLPAGGAIDLTVMLGFSLVLLPLLKTQSRLSRLEGAALLLSYAGYIAWLAMRGG